MDRRTFLAKGWGWAGGLIAAPFAAYAYARHVEPRWLKTTALSLALERLPSAFAGLRIVQFSDIHLGLAFGTERLADLAGRLALLKPDLLAFTGDLYDHAVADADACIRILSGLAAPLGKWAVLGNHDYNAGAARVADLLRQAGFRVLVNDSAPVERGGARMWVAGVDDMWEGKPDAKRAMRGVPPHEFTLLLSHAPDFADIALEHSVDLQLSGHTHGGQVRLPFVGHLKVPLYGEKYVDGLYRLGGGKLQVYVNRGIGMSLYPVRFCCRPEVTVLTLEPARR